jgi:pyruvate/2-oxoglutarate dehydrogenase complex dihydrolipoamide dehydrogenase (E3) component
MSMEQTDVVVIGMGPAGKTPPDGWRRPGCT